MSGTHLRQKIDWKGNAGSEVMQSWHENVDRVIFDLLVR